MSYESKPFRELPTAAAGGPPPPDGPNRRFAAGGALPPRKPTHGNYVLPEPDEEQYARERAARDAANEAAMKRFGEETMRVAESYRSRTPLFDVEAALARIKDERALKGKENTNEE